MFKILISIFLIYQFSWGFLTINDDYSKEIKILRSLDIDPSFLKDPVFISMKSVVDSYRKRHLIKVLEDGHTFIPIIRKMITQAGIPKAFLYLAMVESNFSLKARSKDRAVGLWQFMPQTARLLGLRVDKYIDERKDPIKSTKAAIKYLKMLHNRFGKWYLAALAYNCGEGNLIRAIKRAKSDKLTTLLDSKKKYISKESRLYLRKIIIMANIANDEDFLVKNGLEHFMNRGSTFSLATIVVKGGTPLSSIAKSAKISVKVLKEYNPQLRYYFTPPYDKNYTLYIPYDRYSLFKQNFKPIKSSKKFYVYIVKRGDNLYKISKKFGLTYKVLKDFNHLKDNYLKVGKRLIIPSLLPNIVTYRIKKGDTLYLISKKFKVNIKKIIDRNNLKSTLLKPGEKIVIPN